MWFSLVELIHIEERVEIRLLVIDDNCLVMDVGWFDLEEM